MVRLFSFAQDKPQPFEVSVLIDPFGLRAVSTASSGDSWEVSIHSSNWLMPDGKHRNGDLRIGRTAKKPEIDAWFGRLPANSVVRLLVVDDRKAADGGERYKLVSVLGIGDDVILNGIASELAEVVTFEDNVFGTFTLDRRLDQFCAEVGADGERIHVSVTSSNDMPDMDELALLKSFWADWQRWDLRLREFAAEELINLKQGEWLEEEEAPPTKFDFASRMKPQDIEVDREGEFIVYYDDGDLFFGHSIVVDGTLADGPAEASILG